MTSEREREEAERLLNAQTEHVARVEQQSEHFKREESNIKDRTLELSEEKQRVAIEKERFEMFKSVTDNSLKQRESEIGVQKEEVRVCVCECDLSVCVYALECMRARVQVLQILPNDTLDI